MKKKLLLIIVVFAISFLFTSCELPKGQDPDTMGSATRMMMGLPPKKRDDDISKMMNLTSLMLLAGGSIYVANRSLKTK